MPTDAHDHTAVPEEIPVEFETFLPEENGTFRLARMLLLLDVANRTGRKIQSLDRLGHYEFFSDNPFIVIEGSKRVDQTDRTTLKLAGFTRVRLDYASSGHRFSSRRRRLQHDLALLVAYGLATLTNNGYVITDPGKDIAAQFQSAYADAFRKSSEIVLRRLSSMSNKGLDNAVEEWLGHSWLLLDLLDDVTDAVAPTLNELKSNPDGGKTP